MKLQSKSKSKKEETKKSYEEYTLNDVTMRLYESGFASLSVAVEGGTFIINGNVRQTKDGGYFFSYPSYKGSDGAYHNHVYIMGDDLKADIQLLVNHLTES